MPPPAGEAKPAHADEAVEEFGRSLFLALFDAYPATKAFFPFVDAATGEPEDKELRRHGKTVASAIGEVISLLQASPPGWLALPAVLVLRCAPCLAVLCPCL